MGGFKIRGGDQLAVFRGFGFRVEGLGSLKSPRVNTLDFSFEFWLLNSAVI